jgi:hypothetical protein
MPNWETEMKILTKKGENNESTPQATTPMFGDLTPFV